MTILSELKKEYEKSINLLIKASISLNSLINLNNRLAFILYNQKKSFFDVEVLKRNNSSLERVQNNIDDLIELIETQLIYCINNDPNEIEDIDIYVDNSKLQYIFDNKDNN